MYLILEMWKKLFPWLIVGFVALLIVAIAKNPDPGLRPYILDSRFKIEDFVERKERLPDSKEITPEPGCTWTGSELVCAGGRYAATVTGDRKVRWIRVYRP